jgi:glycosyltransferase involved in cell wall biosynthesis
MKENQIELVRPWWNHKSYHEEKFSDVTVLICQRKTKELITLCLESLLNFYPDIKVLVVDGDSQDESTTYLKFKSSLYPNVKIWERTGINSHGVTMDEAIKTKIDTKYVLLMDSDVITIRGGWVEEMLASMMMGSYAIGALMLVSRSNYAIGGPKDDTDILRYIHPSTGMYDVGQYKKMAPFADHGAPCVFNMIDAEEKGLIVDYYPVDKYVAHLSGASWCYPKPIWPHGFNVRPIPFVTFIVPLKFFGKIYFQKYNYFDIVYESQFIKENVVMHQYGEKEVANCVYQNRMLVNGEYVCELEEDHIVIEEMMILFIDSIIKNTKEELDIFGIKFIKRNKWQQENALR